ncbi:hypothetical protein H4S01_005980 [Coemansia sp. RSA 2610]|nr:hypothetical protein H4S01_005980 [Coemansia sp. RSA 2610]
MLEREWPDWRFSREDLQRTPSVACGWTVEREELDRAKACALIHAAARKLQLPQVTAATACVYLHRFYMRHSLKEYHHYNIAATCLFFACKAEESLRRLDAFIPAIVHYASKGNRRAAPGTGEFDKWRAVILGAEVVLLEALCFDMVVEHPHAALVVLLERLALPRRAALLAWNFLADCMRLPLCLVHDAPTIAAAAVELAARVAPDARPRLPACPADVDRAAQWLLDFYARDAHARGRAAADHTSAAHTPASSPASPAQPAQP